MEIASQALDSTSAVTHRILLLTTQLSESLLASFGAEDGVIAEAMVTRALESNLSIDCALEEVGPVLIDKSDDSTEAGTTRGRYTLETLQKEGYIIFEGSMLPCEARRVDPRSSVKSLDLEPRIIGKAIEPVALPHVARLDKGIPFQRIGRLRDLLVAPDVSQADDLQVSREEGTDLLQLMGIIARKYQLFHTFVIISSASLRAWKLTSQASYAGANVGKTNISQNSLWILSSCTTTVSHSLTAVRACPLGTDISYIK